MTNGRQRNRLALLIPTVTGAKPLKLTLELIGDAHSNGIIANQNLDSQHMPGIEIDFKQNRHGVTQEKVVWPGSAENTGRPCISCPIFCSRDLMCG